ncbi:MAG: HD domain-containing protein [Salibacteraceae bacterium]
MSSTTKSKSLKTFNDPIYGFITIDDELIFQLLEHPSFQRLRRISQLGLTNLVYSGANHSRFQHALGALNLMKSAINVLRTKGQDISKEDEQGALIAIMLHDVGHGPFSHALEKSIVSGLHHEELSLRIMRQLNDEFGGQLSRAIEIYQGTYPLKFLHQLVSSQLDVDRLDYLKRDSFFTGVSEGSIGSERLIKMMCIHQGELAIEAKALYSLEKFLLSRRLMYWQVYLHKAVLSAEFLLMNILTRARNLVQSKEAIWTSETVRFFLENDPKKTTNSAQWISKFLLLDDNDIMFHIKVWCTANDRVLADLCQRLVKRRLLKVKVLNQPLSANEVSEYKRIVADKLNLTDEETSFYLFQKTMTNTAYNTSKNRINVMYKSGEVKDISEAANLFQFTSMEAAETKHFLYYPEGISVN